LSYAVREGGGLGGAELLLLSGGDWIVNGRAVAPPEDKVLKLIPARCKHNPRREMWCS
jgi:hypothetical protein